MDYMIAVLRQYVSIPSVSGNPLLRENCWEAAKYTADILEEIGCTVKFCSSNGTGGGQSTSRPPVIVGRIEANCFTTNDCTKDILAIVSTLRKKCGIIGVSS